MRSVLMLCLVALLAAAAAWHSAVQLRDLRSQVVAFELQPIETLMQDNQALIRELQSDLFTEKDLGILESYLAKVRRDGVPRHADMKQRLDMLAENNSALVALLTAYSPHAKSAAFVSEANKFRDYASAWRDRWNSVMEIFMAGGNYPASEVPFPKEFPASVQAEIDAASPSSYWSFWSF